MIVSTVREPALVVEGLCAGYGKKEILHGVSLSVGRGEIVILLGGNGAGKSTLLKTVAGLLVPTSGAILLGGQDIVPWSVHERSRAGVSYLIQGGRVFPNMTVAENLELAEHHRSERHDLRGTAAGNRLFPELADMTRKKAGLLSGGQRQMLSIEMVISQRPGLLLMDEPSAGLAHHLVRRILTAIAGWARDSAAAVLLIEQNVLEARPLAHRTLMLRNGLIEVATNETVGP